MRGSPHPIQQQIFHGEIIPIKATSWTQKLFKKAWWQLYESFSLCSLLYQHSPLSESPPGHRDYPPQPGSQMSVASPGQWAVRGRDVCHFLAEEQTSKCEFSMCPTAHHSNSGGWTLEILQLQWRSIGPPLANPQKTCSLNNVNLCCITVRFRELFTPVS